MKALQSPDTDIRDAIEGYIEQAQRKQSKHTVRERKRALEYFLDYIVDRYNIETVSDIHPDQVREYRDIRRHEDDVTDVTINAEINSIRGLCNEYNHTDFLVQFDIKVLNLNKRTTVQKSTETPSLSISEYKKIINECENLREELTIRIGFETGIRRSEAVAIDLDDIEHDEITIDSAKSDSNEQRIVYLQYDTAYLLEKYINTERKSYAGSSDSEALFTTQRGRMTGHYINKIFTQKCEQAGIQETVGTNAKGQVMNLYTYHSLRHSFAMQRIKNGMQIAIIADLMGNTIDTIESNYKQTSSEFLKKSNRDLRPDIHY